MPWLCLPRMRGDPPCSAVYLHCGVRSTPHARGSTHLQLLLQLLLSVYPACAGIHLPAIKRASDLPRLPRMRGDPPSSFQDSCALAMSTPHARGSTLFGSVPTLRGQVYPACAGIHLFLAL